MERLPTSPNDNRADERMRTGNALAKLQAKPASDPLMDMCRMVASVSASNSTDRLSSVVSGAEATLADEKYRRFAHDLALMNITATFDQIAAEAAEFIAVAGCPRGADAGVLMLLVAEDIFERQPSRLLVAAAFRKLRHDPAGIPFGSILNGRILAALNDPGLLQTLAPVLDLAKNIERARDLLQIAKEREARSVRRVDPVTGEVIHSKICVGTCTANIRSN
jgi:hypothetical protein